MPNSVLLRGITWNHTRGFLPQLATAQRFEELNPGVTIRWEKRSLQQFADQPIAALARDFDLLVIDHPSIGEAAGHGIFRPLQQVLPTEFIADQAANSVGRSHESYIYDGSLWALATDAATPVSSWRPDLLDKHGVVPPGSWDELLQLADRGLVGVAAIPIDSLMMFYMLCLDEGAVPGQTAGCFVEAGAGADALEAMRELLSRCDEQSLQRNPIQTYEAMTATDRIAYCPFAYGYSNYARPGYARATLRFGGLVERKKGRLRSTLGGAGLALSSACRTPEIAARYCQFVASPECQRGLYTSSGGQPGHRAAWLDAETNRQTQGYFADTLQTLDEAWLRPRQDRYIEFQDQASQIVHACLTGREQISKALVALDTAYARLVAHAHG